MAHGLSPETEEFLGTGSLDLVYGSDEMSGLGPELGVMTSLDSLDLNPFDTDDLDTDVKALADDDADPMSFQSPQGAPPQHPQYAASRASPRKEKEKERERPLKGRQKSFFRGKPQNLVFYTPDVASCEKKALQLVETDTLVESQGVEPDFTPVAVLATQGTVGPVAASRAQTALPTSDLPAPEHPPALESVALRSPSDERGSDDSLPSSSSSQSLPTPRLSNSTDSVDESEESDRKDALEGARGAVVSKRLSTELLKQKSGEMEKRKSLEVAAPPTPAAPLLTTSPYDEPGLLFFAPPPDQPVPERPLIKAGTVEKLVERLSHEKYPDPEYLACFLITYRTFTSPVELLDLLMKRFNLEPPAGASVEEIILFKGKTLFPIRLRIFNVFKQWTERYMSDFDEPELLAKYKKFVQETLCSSGDMFRKLGQQLMDIVVKYERKKQAEQKPAWLRELSASWAEEYVSPSFVSGRVPVQHITTANTIPSKPEFLDEEDDDGEELTSSAVSRTAASVDVGADEDLEPIVPIGAAISTPLRPAIPSTFLELNTVDVAHYLASVESSLMRNIASVEFLKCAWQKKDKATRASNILRTIERFNDVCTWVTSEVMCVSDLKTRAQVISKFIGLAKECVTLGSFNTLFEIITGLQYRPCRRLSKTWAEVPNKAMKEYQELTELMSSLANFAAYRIRLKLHNPPGVPYLGLLLKDLVFAEDGQPDYSGDGLVNFGKQRKIAQLILSFLKYLDTSYPTWSFPRPVVIFCENLTLLDDSEIYEISNEYEPRVIPAGK